MGSDFDIPHTTVSAKSPFHSPMNRRFPAPKAVLFDLDDTLLNSSTMYKLVGAHIIHEMNEQGVGTDPGAVSGGAPQDYFARRYETIPQDQRANYAPSKDAFVQRYFQKFIDTTLKAYREHQIEGMDVVQTDHGIDLRPTGEMVPIQLKWMDGAKETLQYLLQSGIKVAVVTNSPQEVVDHSFVPDLLGPELKDRVPVIGLTWDLKGKPDTDSMEIGLERLGLLRDDKKAKDGCYYVGDSHLHDMKVAHAAGMQGIMIAQHQPSFDRYARDVSEALEKYMNRGAEALGNDYDHLHGACCVGDHEELRKFFDPELNSNLDRGEGVT
ncbi:MAG: HAD family hydrolase [Rickettsiales bacterium]|nr:HAD family hydrolase [Rickettsiales bacterium]